ASAPYRSRYSSHSSCSVTCRWRLSSVWIHAQSGGTSAPGLPGGAGPNTRCSSSLSERLSASAAPIPHPRTARRYFETAPTDSPSARASARTLKLLACSPISCFSFDMETLFTIAWNTHVHGKPRVTPKANLGASVRARLLNKAKAEKIEFQLLLTRFALERLLYRLSISPHRERFLLKGALLFDLWFDEPHRPTRDADFLGVGPADLPTLAATFREICAMDVDDGIAFDPTSVKAQEIRKDANYAGIRITLLGLLDGARCPVRADIGFGDAVTPAAE